MTRDDGTSYRRHLCAERVVPPAGVASADLFFPPQGGDPRPAQRICAQCPVTHECLLDALATPLGEDFGVRGGTTEMQRRALRRGLPRVPAPIRHGTEAGATAHRHRRGEQPCRACLDAANKACRDRKRLKLDGAA